MFMHYANEWYTEKFKTGFSFWFQPKWFWWAEIIDWNSDIKLIN